MTLKVHDDASKAKNKRPPIFFTVLAVSHLGLSRRPRVGEKQESRSKPRMASRERERKNFPVQLLPHCQTDLHQSSSTPSSQKTALVIKFIKVRRHTVRNLHFLSKNSTLISRVYCRFFGVKNSWKCCGFGLFGCWQLWFHEKNGQKKFGWKTRENVGVLSKMNFWTKIRLFE